MSGESTDCQRESSLSLDLQVLDATFEDVSAVTEPLDDSESDNDIDGNEYEAASQHDEDLEDCAEDSLWGTAITMTW